MAGRAAKYTTVDLARDFRDCSIKLKPSEWVVMMCFIMRARYDNEFRGTVSNETIASEAAGMDRKTVFRAVQVLCNYHLLERSKYSFRVCVEYIQSLPTRDSLTQQTSLLPTGGSLPIPDDVWENQINQAKFLSATTTLAMLPIPPDDAGEFQQALRSRLPKELTCCSESDSLVVLPHPEIVAATLLNSMLTKKVYVIPLRSKHEDLSLMIFRMLTDESSSTRQKILEAKKPASYLLNCLPSIIREWNARDVVTDEVLGKCPPAPWADIR